MPRADSKGGVLILRGISADDDQSIAGNIVPDGMGEGGGFAVIDGRDINAATLELVDECLIVIGSHTSPAGTADLTVENGY